MMKNYVIIYRGPLERARLEFILEVFLEGKNQVSFCWIAPGIFTKNRRDAINALSEKYKLNSVTVFPESRYNFLLILLKLKVHVRKQQPYTSVFVGFSAPLYSYAVSGSYTWFINGIPEEEALGKNIIGGLETKLKWLLIKIFDRSLKIVTVSNRMNQYIEKHFKEKTTVAVPTCVATATFKLSNVDRKDYYVYLGSGAKWQAIELTSAIWAELYKQNPKSEFRVISRDERTKILAKDIPPEKIKFVASNDFNQVAGYLNECTVGFLIREDIIVNRVSFPTKLGEYLSSGCWIVSTDLNWDVADFIKKFNVGLLLNPDDDPSKMAEKILDFKLSDEAKSLNARIENCIQYLDRGYWISILRNELNC